MDWMARNDLVAVMVWCGVSLCVSLCVCLCVSLCVLAPHAVCLSSVIICLLHTYLHTYSRETHRDYLPIADIEKYEGRLAVVMCCVVLCAVSA
mmetsp:Transcript_22568/g.64534  ORF Transcript_22568/g.64534 Transcript_22568/m.64534 type:complete len:93 (+) Transcript_22568:329-607(+)